MKDWRYRTMKKRFEMSDEQLAKIIDACKPVPYMVIGGQPPRSQQENANAAWAALGNEMGFKHMTVERCGEDDKVFMAEPEGKGGTAPYTSITGALTPPDPPDEFDKPEGEGGGVNAKPCGCRSDDATKCLGNESIAFHTERCPCDCHKPEGVGE
jgi:hypothetical protein